MKHTLYPLLVSVTLLGCSGGDADKGSTGVSSGGAPSGGSSGIGAQNSGGNPQSSTGGGSSGAIISGGASSATGAVSSTAALGGSAGGAPTVGGATPNGGSGGNRTLGGSSGTATGGTVASGGGSVVPIGGTTANGGRLTTGGAPSSGGVSNGGASGSGVSGSGVSSGGGAQSSAGMGSGGTAVCAAPTTKPGQPFVFNDNGGWCWYQDERAIVDVEANKLIIGSVAIGGTRGGDQEAVIYDLASGTVSKPATLGSNLSPDDHNTPAIVKVGAGKYLAVYTGHNQDCKSYYNIYDSGSWGAQKSFDWTSLGCPTADNRTISYSNLWQMPGKIFNFVRSIETSPNLITTTDGSTFTYVGRLTKTPQVGYVAGYYKYWGNSLDRIDFVATEAHPRDNDNSLYHGYVKAEGSTITRYDSMGTAKGNIDSASKTNAPDVPTFTKIFATGTTLKGVKLEHMWNHDIVRYTDGTIVVLGQGRVTGTGSTDPDKRFIYLRFDGSKWSATYLVKGGTKLYADEQDYTGLSAAHPTDPTTIYVSTMFDPRDDNTKSTKREIWRGTTCDQGKTFTWTPITSNSTEDNIRPIVPYWPGGKTALLWMRGNYLTAQTYQTKVVGLILNGS